MNTTQKLDRGNLLVETLGLERHPEGGFFKETYRSSGSIPRAALTVNFKGDRSYCTGIYFLLKAHDFSAFHRINTDEMWHYYEGSPVAIYHFEQDQLIKTIVGPVGVGIPQFVVPGGCWFAAEPVDPEGYSFVGCTVAPGFDFSDFELAERDFLIAKWPQFKPIIKRLTRADKL